MRKKTKTSRLELIKLRKRKELVARGIEILTGKRDALLGEFRNAVKQTHDARRQLESDMQVAARAFMTAMAEEPDHLLASSALASQGKITFGFSMKNIRGVKVPVIRFSGSKRSPFERGSFPGRRSLAVDETAGEFETVIGSLVASAQTDVFTQTVGSAVKRATRRINALEGKVAPEVSEEIKLLSGRLEEMEREDSFRLKRYKTLREKRADIHAHMLPGDKTSSIARARGGG